ncbi:MAG TPA: hypothetical protein VF346_08120 [Bacteroidales bacterium]
MNYTSGLNKADISIDENVRKNIMRNNLSQKNPGINPAIANLISEGDENFLYYLQWQGLADDTNLLVLSSKSHYYYDSEELKDVTTLINLKKLNLIKHLDEFLNTLCYGLSPKTNFIGCFTDRKSQKGHGMTSRIYNKIVNFLDSKTDIEIDSKEISTLLESVGFKVKNMTEINGLTYFLSQISNA